VLSQDESSFSLNDHFRNNQSIVSGQGLDISIDRHHDVQQPAEVRVQTH
jgi:hypothetical protein